MESASPPLVPRLVRRQVSFCPKPLPQPRAQTAVQVVAGYPSFFGLGLLAYGLTVWPQKRPSRASLASNNHNRGLILGGYGLSPAPVPRREVSENSG